MPGSEMLLVGLPFTPNYLFELLKKFNPKHGFEHVYQEDAQEFLNFLLNEIHEEFLSGL